MQISDIDNGKAFDWGNTSKDYAKYRDIYPKEFYRYILDLGLCKDGQKVLAISTVAAVVLSRYSTVSFGTPPSSAR